ncbi:CRASP family complement regulator-acquiring lipoprotein (plasmid) [Borreliella finlandensis]|uniref:Borrelia virulent strain associated lipoprotein n=1 Tax=Borreliella finlandensis TaxID=498741 RepID=A0A806C3P1_9SPIR|nr:CRASP family complement regulator-acquiring lipoprotein [Borreliella finlandensis]ACN93538.1 Borrelia virulent strain associated lipoprotein [Borreliella finlandensis]
MKNNIILCMCVFLLLNSCTVNHDTETKIKKHADKTKNEYINEIKNLIATTKESIDKRKLLQSKPADQNLVDDKNNKKVFEIDKRAFDFINSFLTNDEFNKFATIFNKPTLKSPGKVLNSIAILELNLEQVIIHLGSKKDALDKANTSDLEKIKNSLEQLFSIRIFFSTIIKRILLDHQNNKNSKSEETYFDTIYNQFNEKNKEVGNLRKTILSLPN